MNESSIWFKRPHRRVDQWLLIEEVICLSFLDTVVLQTRMAPMRPLFGGFIIEVAFAVSMLMVSLGILYVLIKLGSYLEAMKKAKA
jgi:hypothetical protein